ncbi:ABC transporter permease [Pleomorphomonas sp. NRK KF1]|uniref:ABC transporter permease n=1 Tax=Pleomorphomonas sp. NRK KF1 TaxID=2943000 RepID=UPI002043C14D|nr:ABC transporter permease [Pleomorphomonas sp. NRK KF1]MCM5552103.1 ABC transporter permease [Pleomorphomonas sp. NRK KF1]
MELTRLLALVRKEFLALFRDPKSRMILIAPPVLQLLVFSYAATLEVRNVDVMVLNRDAGHWGSELTSRIEASPQFRLVRRTDNPEELREAIDRERVIAAVEIGADFSRNIEAGETADVAIILDGRRSNASQIVSGYISSIATGLAADTPAGQRLASVRVGTVARNWFNPNLDFKWFMVPGLVASIAMLVGLLVTALSIARERELGTFDQLMVSPLRTHEILVGKVIPPILIGFLHITLFVLAAVWIFGIPLRGSVVALYVAAFFYLISLVGFGLFISALAATQQQAILGAFLFLAPAMLLSGFATPIANMPEWLQILTYVNPLRYFLVIVRGVFLKDIPIAEIVVETVPMALIACVTLPTAGWLFRRRLE